MRAAIVLYGALFAAGVAALVEMSRGPKLGVALALWLVACCAAAFTAPRTRRRK